MQGVATGLIEHSSMTAGGVAGVAAVRISMWTLAVVNILWQSWLV